MAESHLAYMHGSFPAARNNDHTPHLTHMHSTEHHDGMLRKRVEGHSVPDGDGGGLTSGHGHASMGHAKPNMGGHNPNVSVGKGTV